MRAAIVACETTTPLGAPVEPEVSITNAKWSGVTRVSGRSAEVFLHPRRPRERKWAEGGAATGALGHDDRRFGLSNNRRDARRRIRRLQRHADSAGLQNCQHDRRQVDRPFQANSHQGSHADGKAVQMAGPTSAQGHKLAVADPVIFANKGNAVGRSPRLGPNELVQNGRRAMPGSTVRRIGLNRIKNSLMKVVRGSSHAVHEADAC